MTRSALYVGRVRHRRMGGPAHEFTYPVWHAMLDLDEVPAVALRTRGFSHNRLNITSFDDRDHMGPTTEPVRAKLERWLESCGATSAFNSVALLTHLRLFGHVFNPVSFYFCRDGEDRLQHVVAEVLPACGRRPRSPSRDGQGLSRIAVSTGGRSISISDHDAGAENVRRHRCVEGW